MKKYLSALTVLLILQSQAYSNRYYINQGYPYRTYQPYIHYGICQPECFINRMPYYPRNTIYSSNAGTKAKRLRRVRRLEKLRNSYRELSFLNKRNKGALTGYSVPVTKDIYEQAGILPNDTYFKKPAFSKELFSAPAYDNTYYNNGIKYNGTKDVSGKTGVTIIYD